MRKSLMLMLLLPALFMISCEDPLPSDYKPDVIVEAFLIVDKPIENIVLMRTQPLNTKFNYDSSLITKAKVIISTESDSWELSFRYGEGPGWYFPDTTVKIKPETRYFFKAILDDNTVLTGETTTPKRFKWIIPLKDYMQYPKDSIGLPFIDTLVFSWEATPGTEYYLIKSKCLDTLNYGKYLTPPTSELNRRVFLENASEEYYLDDSAWGFIPSTITPIVWQFFKWFGKHKASVYSPDVNMLKWFQQYMIKGNYDPLLGCIKGGKGCFGSASEITKEFFIYKNQP